MMTTAPDRCRPRAPAPWHNQFLSILPSIRRHAGNAFRHLRGDDLDDAVSEVVANALTVFVRLVELGKTDLAYPDVLARYGVAQILSGHCFDHRPAKSDVPSFTQGDLPC